MKGIFRPKRGMYGKAWRVRDSRKEEKVLGVAEAADAFHQYRKEVLRT